MRKVAVSLLPALIGFLVAGCQESLDANIARYQKLEWKKITKADLELCKGQGGTYKEVGIVGIPSCVIPFADAGKICRDSDECLGKCTVELDGSTSVDSRSEGKCEADNAHFGCFAEVLNGVAQPGICVD